MCSAGQAPTGIRVRSTFSRISRNRCFRGTRCSDGIRIGHQPSKPSTDNPCILGCCKYTHASSVSGRNASRDRENPLEIRAVRRQADRPSKCEGCVPRDPVNQAHASGWSLRPCVENDFVLVDFASTKVIQKPRYAFRAVNQIFLEPRRGRESILVRLIPWHLRR
jgi:hypothetical protein